MPEMDAKLTMELPACPFKYGMACFVLSITPLILIAEIFSYVVASNVSAVLLTKIPALLTTVVT